jgi:predicted nucleic acid-binding protein
MHTISKVFIDTNVFVAIRDTNDNTHQKAIKISDFLSKNNIKLFTTSLVLTETLTILSQKLGKDIALDWYNDYKNSLINEVFIDQQLFKNSIELFKKTKPENISLVDCSNVIVMKQNKIDTIFSFDEDFKNLGVKLLGDVVNYS